MSLGCHLYSVSALLEERKKKKTTTLEQPVTKFTVAMLVGSVSADLPAVLSAVLRRPSPDQPHPPPGGDPGQPGAPGEPARPPERPDGGREGHRVERQQHGDRDVEVLDQPGDGEDAGPPALARPGPAVVFTCSINNDNNSKIKTLPNQSLL